MSDERKELSKDELLGWFGDFAIGDEDEQAFKQIRQLIQQKPERKIEIDEKYVEEKAIKLREVTVFLETESNNLKFSISQEKAEDFITQIISDVKGGKK